MSENAEHTTPIEKVQDKPISKIGTQYLQNVQKAIKQQHLEHLKRRNIALDKIAGVLSDNTMLTQILEDLSKDTNNQFIAYGANAESAISEIENAINACQEEQVRQEQILQETIQKNKDKVVKSNLDHQAELAKLKREQHEEIETLTYEHKSQITTKSEAHLKNLANELGMKVLTFAQFNKLEQAEQARLALENTTEVLKEELELAYSNLADTTKANEIQKIKYDNLGKELDQYRKTLERTEILNAELQNKMAEALSGPKHFGK